MGFSLGVRDDVETVGVPGSGFEGNGGFLRGAGEVGGDFFDPADDQVFRDEVGGESEDAGLGIETGVAGQVNNVGGVVFEGIAPLGAGFQLGGDFYIRAGEGDYLDNRRLD